MDQKIFDGAVDFQSTPPKAELGTSHAFLSAILIHFSKVPTTSEKLVISYVNDKGDEYTTELHSEDPFAESSTDFVLEWDNGFVLDPGDTLKIAYPNTDKCTIGITVKYRYF